MKKCSKCKVEKDLTEFNKNKSKKDGLGTECRVCSTTYCNKYNNDNKITLNEKKRLYRQDNRFHYLEYLKKYYQNNKSELIRRFKSSIQAAKARNKEWDLNFKEYCEIVKNSCYYCDNLLGESVVSGSGLDRLDNNMGYNTDNCVSCCKECNLIKGYILTPDETKVAVSAILKKRGLYKIIEAEFD